MPFSSIIFICLFLPLTIFLYRLSPVSVRNGLLVVLSLMFYSWGEQVYVVILVVSILFNYGLSWAIFRFQKSMAGKLFLWVAVVSNIGLLGYFKYVQFFILNFNWMLQRFHIEPLSFHEVHLPIGISFFTFKVLSYLIDIYRRNITPEKNLVNLALYVSFFPQLSAGPITRFSDMADAINSRSVNFDVITRGIERFIIGLGKKVLIANTLSLTSNQIFAIGFQDLSPAVAWLGIFCYTLQIYFDFSGYSDMAIGLGRMFGFHTPENFNYPYCATSIQDFWRRWHISLSTWFRDYLYIPLGGNRKGGSRTYLNLIIVFFLCGLWHGANWTFVVWGIFHGMFLVIERAGLSRLLEKCIKPVRYAYVMTVVSIGWVFFRSGTLSDAVNYLKCMAGWSFGNHMVHPLAMYLDREIVFLIIAGTVFSTPVSRLVFGHHSAGTHHAGMDGGNANAFRNVIRLGFMCMVFVLSLAYLVSGTVQSFIYFQF